MSSSTLAHYLRFPTADLDTDDGVHAALVKHAVVGNVNHIADQCAQTRVKWVGTAAAPYYEPEFRNKASPATIGTGATNYYRCWASTPFDLHVRDDDLSYRLRVRVRGARSAGTGTITFRLVVAAERQGESYVFDTTNINVAVATSSSATHAWLTLSPAYLSLTAQQVELARRAVDIRDSVGGIVAAGSWLRCTAEVWGRTTDTGSIPRVSGCIVEEFFAP